MRLAHAPHSVGSDIPMAVPRTAVAAFPSSGWTALKILGGAALAALSFWVTLHAIEYFQSRWEPIRSSTILTFGDAFASAITFNSGAKFQFPGIGYVQIQDTKALHCHKFKCSFSLAVSFSPSKTDPQLIIGQSYYGEIGWHLLWSAGHLLLQTDGGANSLAVPFVPKVGQRYKIDIARDDDEVKLSVDDVVLGRSKQIPFTDLGRDLTIGGRAGPVLLPLAGAITDVTIARHRPE